MKSSTPPSTGSETFSGCSSLTTVYVPEGATSAYNDVSPWGDYEIVEFLDALNIPVSVTLPSVGTPEHLYTMKSGNNYYANGTTSPTQTAANRACFALYQSEAEGAYYIYCYTSNKWLGYTKSSSYNNGTGFIVLSDTKTEGAYFKCNNYSGDNYDIAPYNTTGVASKYLNWYQGLYSNPLDGTVTLGLWEQDGATDAGSRWVFSEVFRPISLSTTLPSEGKPEHLYTMKNGNGLYANGATSPTLTEANRALFAFYDSDVAGAYYIYCYSSQKWLGYDNTNSDTNMRNFIQLSKSKADAAYFKLTFNEGNGCYDIVPYNATGVASKYLNWYGSTNHNPLDGTNTLGLWEQDGATDAGSRWIFAEVIVSDPWNFSDNGSAIYAQARDVTKVEITYTRNYAHTGWQALYVPFDIPYDEISDNFDVSELNDVHQFDDDGDGAFDRTELEVLRLKAGDVIAHNTPYVIRAKAAGEHTITLTDATLYAAEETSCACTSVKRSYEFRGTYAGVSGADMLSGGYYAFSGGTLCKAASSSTALGGFRWYVSVTDRATGLPVSPAALPAKMRIVENEGGEATGIAAAPSAAPLLKDAPVYDLNGRRIGKADAMDALPKGVYIVNGKKVIR